MISRPFLAAAGSLALLCGCSDGPEKAPAPPPAVEVIAARSGDLPLVAHTHGDVRARTLVELRPEISAQVAKVSVDTGDAVRRGQVLVQLRSDRLEQ